MSELTVVCAASGPVWIARARRALDSVLALAPDVRTILYTYKRRAGRGDADRLQGILQAETPWVLSIDADVLAAGDVHEPVQLRRSFGWQDILVRASPLHEHPAWHNDRWLGMLASTRLAPRAPVWNGAFYITRELADRVIPRLPHWTRFCLDYRPIIFDRPHRKPGQVAVTMALAEAGVTDGLTGWKGPETFSWHSRPETPGIIHHFNGVVYAELEAAGRLESALEERRHEQ